MVVFLQTLGNIGASAAVTIGNPMEYFTSHTQDEHGNVWITNLDGLYKLNVREWIKFDQEQKQLPAKICNKVIETHDNAIWVAIKYGIAKQTDNRFARYVCIKTITNGLHDNYIKSVFEDKQNNIWVATKGGISKYNK